MSFLDIFGHPTIVFFDMTIVFMSIFFMIIYIFQYIFFYPLKLLLACVMQSTSCTTVDGKQPTEAYVTALHVLPFPELVFTRDYPVPEINFKNLPLQPHHPWIHPGSGDSSRIGSNLSPAFSRLDLGISPLSNPSRDCRHSELFYCSGVGDLSVGFLPARRILDCPQRRIQTAPQLQLQCCWWCVAALDRTGQ